LDEKWVVAEDRNGDLMAVRKDGGEIGHISHGRIEVLAELTESDQALHGVASVT
jgi:hypothetical protein